MGIKLETRTKLEAFGQVPDKIGGPDKTRGPDNSRGLTVYHFSHARLLELVQACAQVLGNDLYLYD